MLTRGRLVISLVVIVFVIACGQGLTAGTVYNYRVSAIYDNHTSAPSNSASATTHVIAIQDTLP